MEWVDEALEIALQAIDIENSKFSEGNLYENKDKPNIMDMKLKNQLHEPIYENTKRDNLENKTDLTNSTPIVISNVMKQSHQNAEIDESYYQVPKSLEPYYEVPKSSKIVPVYENIDMIYSNVEANFLMDETKLEPPKEKPPPPPINENLSDDETNNNKQKTQNESMVSTKCKTESQNIKRMNSTKRIKKELRNKRSSFLGIERSNDDDNYLELTVPPPPDMAQLLEEERRLEKQLYMRAGLYESSDTGESRDSGVSENHSRQSSEPFTNSSEEHDDFLIKKEKEIIEVLEKEEVKRRNVENWSITENPEEKMQSIEDQIREQEEVLRVERELIQLEQEEIKRQRENLIQRENLARRELEHGAKMLMSAKRRSLQDINTTTNHYANIPNQIYQINTDYRKSMSDLQILDAKRIPPIPPAKPLRTHLNNDNRYINNNNCTTINPIQHSRSTDEFAPLRNFQPNSVIHHGNMTRHTLHALSATPKPKFTDGWVQYRKSPEKINDSWLISQQKRKSIPENFNYNKHWLIQEAEQRRIDQQRGIRNNNTTNDWSNIRTGNSDNKPLPDAVIQTLTQRLQNKGIGERKRLETSPLGSLQSISSSSTISPTTPISSEISQDKILSVSGKKKCSHCTEELGRGAAMIIESLKLFYHMDCFKCCVCHVQLGDGLNGTDVRVRNQKLHCQNCYSSDDGIKFSCV